MHSTIMASTLILYLLVCLFVVLFADMCGGACVRERDQ